MGVTTIESGAVLPVLIPAMILWQRVMVVALLRSTEMIMLWLRIKKEAVVFRQPLFYLFIYN